LRPLQKRFPLLYPTSYSNRVEQLQFPHKLFISRNNPTDFNQRSKLANPDSLKLEYYVPGTSLRGPFRAQAECIIRSLAPESAAPPRTACDPFDTEMQGEQDPSSCSKRLEAIAPQYPYKEACPACKLFGCTGTASRVHFEDAEVKDGYNSVYRDMIGIDRFTGGVYSGANMRFHALEKAPLTPTVTVHNFELWQLGLLAYVFRDFEKGLVPIGFGKTKGFGLVQGKVKKVTLTYPKARCDGTTIPHLGCLVSAEERTSYGFHDEPALTFDLLKKRDAGPLGLYDAYDVEPNACDAFCAAVAPAFDRFIDSLSHAVCS
jgi:CRISPR-associated protein Csm3